MNLRPHPALSLALATALAGTAAGPAVADDSDEPMVQRCYTVALTPEEVEAGMVSEIDCYEVPADEPPMAMRSGITYAIIYDNVSTTGDSLSVTSGTGPATCTGASVVFGTGNAWDNKISATDLVSCGSAKHHQWSNFTGNNQLVNTTGVVAMTTAMDNSTSSIQYAP